MSDRGDRAGRPSEPARHPLEPQRSVEPPATVTARHFFIREVGILFEQGVVDRARMLLARRTHDAPDEPEAYLDAMRFELGMPSSGAAWAAWMARALKAGVPVATYIRTIVPERQLGPELLEVRASAFLKQPDRGSALELLRLRAATALLAGDPRALDLLDDEVLEHAASDAELAQLCLHVLAARAFTDPDHVERLAAKLDAASKSASDGPARGELRAAIATGRGYRSLTIAAPCPAPLERALGLFGRCDAGADRALLADLERGLRAQPAPYLAWADEVAAAAPALIDAWLIRFRSLSSALGEPIATPRSDALIRDAIASVERDARRFLPLPHTSRTMYRKHVRPKVLAAILAPAPATELGAVVASARSYTGAIRRVLEPLVVDSALVLLDQLLVTSASRGSSPETTAHR